MSLAIGVIIIQAYISSQCAILNESVGHSSKRTDSIDISLAGAAVMCLKGEVTAEPTLGTRRVSVKKINHASMAKLSKLAASNYSSSSSSMCGGWGMLWRKGKEGRIRRLEMTSTKGARYSRRRNKDMNKEKGKLEEGRNKENYR